MSVGWRQERYDLFRFVTGVPGMRASIHVRSKHPKPYRVIVCGFIPDKEERFTTITEAKAYVVRIMKYRAKRLVKALA